MIRDTLVGLGEEVHVAPGCSSHALSYSVRLLGAFEPIVGVELRIHGILPRFPQFAEVFAGFPTELKFFARRERIPGSPGPPGAERAASISMRCWDTFALLLEELHQVLVTIPDVSLPVPTRRLGSPIAGP